MEGEIYAPLLLSPSACLLLSGDSMQLGPEIVSCILNINIIIEIIYCTEYLLLNKQIKNQFH